MSAPPLDEIANAEYKAGFVTDIESDTVPAGLNEDVVRLISAKKGEPPFLLEWRLKAYRHWLTMTEPTWPNVHYPPIDYQAAVYYSAPKQKKDGPKSLDEVDPKLLETYEKLGVPLHERARLAGVAGGPGLGPGPPGASLPPEPGPGGGAFLSVFGLVRRAP